MKYNLENEIETLDVLKSTFPVFYFVKMRKGSTKLRSIFLVISIIQNREKKNFNIEKLSKQTFSWGTQKPETKRNQNQNQI